MAHVSESTDISGKVTMYLGLVEDVSAQVKKAHQAFKSAKDNLEYAITASGQNQLDYIRQTKNMFVDAVTVEENENKILAIVGLSMCQYLLGDNFGAQYTMEIINDVELTRAERIKAMFKIGDGIIVEPAPIFPLGCFPFGAYYGLRILSFNITKEKAINMNMSLIGT